MLKTKEKIYISLPEINSPVGYANEFFNNILNGKSGIKYLSGFIDNIDIPLGQISNNIGYKDLYSHLQVKEFDSRTNYILVPLLENIKDNIDNLKAKYGSERIGISFGTTNPGMEENLFAMQHYIKTNDFSKYSQDRNSLYNPARFCSKYLDIHGPCFTISTACTSGIKAIIQGYKLIKAGICDAVLCGASDSLNSLTINGFNNLQILSHTISNPFSKNRDGVNLGEAAVLFILTKHPHNTNVYIKAYSANNDAYHITKQDPCSPYAVELLKQIQNNMDEKIDYINLHGTGTISNDQVESYAINQVFGTDILCSGIKQLVGHSLGAAGCLETALCVLLVNKGKSKLPPHIYDEMYDEKLHKIKLVEKNDNTIYNIKNACNINFAFGGDNCAIAVGCD